MFPEKELKTTKEYKCELCKFSTSKLFDYNRHLSTSKHKLLTQKCLENEKNEANNKKKYQCGCGKKYNYRQSLYVHKKSCKGKSEKDNDLEKEKDLEKEEGKIDLVTFLLKENSELKGMILEVCKNMKSITTNNTNSNNNNTTFNLQFFLNETCKDAINLSEFVENIKLELTDLENVGSKGYVAGISDIILKNLKPLDVTMRPVHCSDLKREVVYVKEENVWSNDSKENQQLKKAIKQVTNKNIGVIKEWKEKYPDCVNSDSRKSDIYNQIIGESMDHNAENSEKIIKRIAKEVTIDKNAF